ncbi:hypothetical protein EAF04_010366 [Stromatinia cepivora]|nr:hypothetical protein EAF04_010366 [Stromatinia cepivora]
MPHHLTSFFKSAAGVANGVLGNTVNMVNMQGDSLKGNRNRNQDQNRRQDQLQTENINKQSASSTSKIAAADQQAQVFADSQVATESKTTKGTGTAALTKITTENGRMVETSKISGTSKNCNPIDTSNSTSTNPNENLPPTPCLKAVDGLDAEVSPTDGLGGFNGEFGGRSVNESDRDGEEDVGSGVGNAVTSGLETGVKNHSGVNTTATSIQLPISSLASSTTTTTKIEHTATRNRAFTIPRKPLITNRREFLDWKAEYGGIEGLECARGGEGRGQGQGEGAEGLKSVKSEVVGERKEERSVRLERERMERGGRDLHHENPLHSHPIQPTTISHGTPPTTSPLYSCTSSPSIKSKSRAFRRSYTAPIHGFNFVGIGFGGKGVEAFGAEGMGGINEMGRGTARDRYSGNSNTSASGSGGLGLGSRTGSFLRRASVSLRGMQGMGFMRSSSGGVAGGIDATGNEGMEGMGINAERNDTNTIPSEYLRGVGGYAGDGMAMGMGKDITSSRERLDSDAERRRSHRQSLILPKFEWEDEFVGGGGV